jgi:hypothetical protein
VPFLAREVADLEALWEVVQHLGPEPAPGT